MPLPDQLPPRLTITLWDFSWYVRTGPGEPFEDLDRAFAEAVERGYNTIRICAMPFLLFGSGLDTTALRLGPLGGGYGQRVRWYDVGEPTVIDARAQLLALFEAARRHDCYVIVSSWEYQQSSSFAADPAWCDALMAIDPEDRAGAPGRRAGRPDRLPGRARPRRPDRLHRDPQRGPGRAPRRRPATGDETPDCWRSGRGWSGQSPRSTPATRTGPVTVNYARVPVGAMRGIPENIDVLVTHPYVYGVLGAFIDDVRPAGPGEDFDQARAARDILLPDAPQLADWAPDAAVAAGRHDRRPSRRSTCTTGATPRRSTAGSTATTRPGSRP